MKAIKSTAVLSDVLEKYDVDYPISLDRLGSRTNDSYLVTTHSDRFVLRQSHESRSLEALIFEHRVLHFLAEEGFPLAAPLSMGKKETWRSVAGRLWTLSPFVEGEHLSRSHPSHLETAARKLAIYHRLIRAFEANDPQSARTQDLTQWLKTTVATSVPLPPAGQETLDEARRTLVEALGRLHVILAGPNRVVLPKLVIHGDFSRRNLLFQGDALVAVLDFDGCYLEMRAVDLAIAIKNLCRGPRKHSHLELARVGTFAAAYKAEQPLMENEVATLPFLIQSQRLRSLVARYVRLCFSPREIKTDRIEKFLWEVERFRWLEDHHEDLVKAILA